VLGAVIFPERTAFAALQSCIHLVDFQWFYAISGPMFQGDISYLMDWGLGGGVLVAMFAVTAAARSYLRRFGARRRWTFLETLANPIASLLYIVGLRLFGDVVPLHTKVALWLEHGIYVLGVVLVIRLLSKAATIGLEWGGKNSTVGETLQTGFIPLLRNVVTLFLVFTGAIMVMQHFHYDVMSLLAALGVGSLAVGLAAKESLSHMIAGFTLIIDQNLRHGDEINLNGSTGKVEEIGLRSTRLLTPDGNILIVPNSDLVNNKILNYTLPTPSQSYSISLRISYDTPFDHVRRLAQETLKQVSGLHSAGQAVHLSRLDDGHQLVSVGFSVQDRGASAQIVSQIHEQLLSRLQAEKIPLLAPLQHGLPR